MPNYIGPSNGDPFFELFENITFIIAFCTYISYIILNFLGRLQDILRKWGIINQNLTKESELTKSFVPLYTNFESFYTRNVYRRIRDCWNRPVCSSPGVEMDLQERTSNDSCWTFQLSGKKIRVLNFGSYNYLGFAGYHKICFDDTKDSIIKFGIGIASPQQEIGKLTIHEELEALLAQFLGQEDSIICPMGFATNSLNIPRLFDKDSCVISDELNHTSLILGIRLSGAHVYRFKHNDMTNLEKHLSNAIIYGKPRTHRPFKRIFIVVEGVYSMEGSIAHLPEIIALKKRYKAYLYLDEAHSIGALGETGRGVVEYFGMNPRDVDIAMGTFTKSFASAGGYLAGSRKLITYIRTNSLSAAYGASMPAPVCQQIISTLHIMMGTKCPGEGRDKLRRLLWNVRYFRARLHRMGLVVYGNRDSPVVPVMLYMPGNIAEFSRKCLSRGLGVVIVGFPATALLYNRCRFCISASHTREMLDFALDVVNDVVEEMGLRYSRMPPPYWTIDALKPLEDDENPKTEKIFNKKMVNGELKHNR